jgi:hypothetical protein
MIVASTRKFAGAALGIVNLNGATILYASSTFAPRRRAVGVRLT